MSAGFGIYVHWPYCESKCPYCDFNSHVADTVDHGRWRAAYLSELDRYAAETGDRTVTSVFFGGGTPSLMKPDTVAAVIERIRAGWPVAEDVEITAEANPSSSEAALFAAFADAGVNRLSIGVQSFDDAALKFLGRRHKADEARRAIEAAREAVPRFSFDLIYALPGQTAADWRRQLTEAASLAGGHLSVYQLAIEPGTEFHRRRVEGAEDETAAELYEVTQEVLAAAGLPAYEISNHARPDDACRHNLTYWRGGAYAGIGPGAHGRLRTGGAWALTLEKRMPDEWLRAVETEGAGLHKRTPIDPDERAREAVLLGMRLAGGLSAADFAETTGLSLEDWLDGDRLDVLADEELIAPFDGARLRALPDGLMRLNAVLDFLLN